MRVTSSPSSEARRDVAARKAALRREAMARREALDPATRARHSAEAARHVLALIDRAPPASLAAFVPIGAEIDPSAIVAAAADRAIAVALPAMEGRTVVFRRFRPGDALVAGPMGTREPAREAEELVADMWVVPLLAFDRRGGRLGYGAGGYDRAIAQALAKGVRPRLVGYAFSVQEVDRVPLEPHDRPLDAVVTEQGLLMCDRED